MVGQNLGFSLLLALIAFLVFPSDGLYAQSTRTMDAAARRLDEFRKQSEKAERDEMAKDMNGRKVSPEERKRAAAIKEQLKEDLEFLQTEYNTLITKLKSREPFTPAETNEIGERVYSRSTRLLKNLNIPAASEGETAAVNRPTADIRTLCFKIFAFVTHPMLESPSTIDVKSSAEARSLLEEVIWISDSLRQAK